MLRPYASYGKIPNDQYSGYKSNYNKKITKSSTTLFNEVNKNGNYTNSNEFSTFTHSTSYDNIGMIKPSSANDINASHGLKFKSKNFYNSQNDGFENSKRIKNFNYKQNPAKPSEQFNSAHFEHNSSNDTSINNSSSTTNGNNSGKEQIVLHVKNLDYKISADEWKRILLENFRKHCKDVS